MRPKYGISFNCRLTESNENIDIGGQQEGCSTLDAVGDNLEDMLREYLIGDIMFTTDCYVVNMLYEEESYVIGALINISCPYAGAPHVVGVVIREPNIKLFF